MKRWIFLICILVCSGITELTARSGEQQSALIIEGDSPDMVSSFRSFIINNPDIHFDIYQYASLYGVGAGNGIQIDIHSIEIYDYILISVHQGSLAPELVTRLTKYVKEGGRLYLLYQSHPKPYFIESMESSSNDFLKKLGVEDEVFYENAFFDDKVTGSLIPVSNEERRINASRKSVNQLKKGNNHRVAAYKANMASGHYFHRNSNLEHASLIYEFNSLDVKHAISAFWKCGNGVFGLGTEKYTSGERQRDVYAAWRSVWDGLNLDDGEEEVEYDIEGYAGDEEFELTDRRMEQIRKQEKLNQERLEAELKQEKERKEEEFRRYSELEHKRLAEIKRQNAIEESRLKEELENEIAAAKSREETPSDDTARRNLPVVSVSQNDIYTEQITYRKAEVEKHKETTSEGMSRWDKTIETKKTDLDLIAPNMAPNQLLIRNLDNVVGSMDEYKLADLVEQAKENKNDVIIIESHLNYEEPVISNTLRSVKVSEKLKQHFVRQGIPANRIMVKGLGSTCNMDDQVIVDLYTPRLDLEGRYDKDESKLFTSTDYDLYLKQNAGLKFRIMLGSNPSSWQPDLIEKYGNFSLEQFGNQRTKFGMLGLFTTQEEARAVAQELSNWRYSAPRVIAYLDGVKLSDEQIESLRNIYPELREYQQIVK